jgi:tRNA-guanine family transglycosylase
MSLIYGPVSTSNNDLLNAYHPNCLFNPIRQKPINHSMSIEPAHFADSGGYQLYSNSDNKIKKSMVLSGVGIKNNSRQLVIDPLALCRQYGRLEIKHGFTLDWPLPGESSQEELDQNLKESYEWASVMFKYRPKLCPDTEFLIPLQASSIDQLHMVFKTMNKLNPDGYAFPVRGSFDLDWVLWIAYMLSFLNSMNVKKVHMLGTSRKEVILIAAAAVGLKMFDQVSFDSTSWNTMLRDKKPKYYDPRTLKAKYVSNNSVVDILLPDHIKKIIQSSTLNLDKNLKQQLLMMHNAFAISQYAEKMANQAKDIESFIEYIKNQNYPISKINRVLAAIKVLTTTVSKGHEFVEKWLNWLW